jgi:hypothetical protein
MSTHNAHIDYFGFAVENKIVIKVSSENRSIQSVSGANSYGDAAVVDTYGETAAPSAEYDIVGEVAHDPSAAGTTLVTLGTVNTPTGLANPVVLGSLTISTQNGSAPSMSASGQMVQIGAAQLRVYKLPAFTLSPRHRAQDFLGLCAIKKGANAASPITDYGLESVSANFPIQITLAQPNGNVMNYDIHGDMATVDFSMNWYSNTAPTIDLTAAATALGAKMQNLASRSDPENGYTQYTWQVFFPLTGEEYVAPQSNS